MTKQGYVEGKDRNHLFKRPVDGLYYDLIRVPHGHIPAPKIRGLLAMIPMRVKETRTDHFYECPECGSPSFFKIEQWCGECGDFFFFDAITDDGNKAFKRYRKRQRRYYFNNLFKRIEILLLPVLLFFGKAWYVHSSRHKHWGDM